MEMRGEDRQQCGALQKVYPPRAFSRGLSVLSLLTSRASHFEVVVPPYRSLLYYYNLARPQYNIKLWISARSPASKIKQQQVCPQIFWTSSCEAKMLNSPQTLWSSMWHKTRPSPSPLCLHAAEPPTKPTATSLDSNTNDTRANRSMEHTCPMWEDHHRLQLTPTLKNGSSTIGVLVPSRYMVLGCLLTAIVILGVITWNSGWIELNFCTLNPGSGDSLVTYNVCRRSRWPSTM